MRTSPYVEKGPWSLVTLHTAVANCSYGNVSPDRIHASYETMQVLVRKISSDVTFPVSEQLHIMGMSVRLDPLLEFGKLHVTLDRPQFHCTVIFEGAD